MNTNISLLLKYNTINTSETDSVVAIIILMDKD